MKKFRIRLMQCILVASLIVCGLSITNVQAACNHRWIYGWEDEWNDTQHKITYYCDECFEYRYEYEEHIWENDSYVSNEENDSNYHIRSYYCEKCGYQKQLKEKHIFSPSDLTEEYNSDNHYRIYYCDECYFDKKVKEPHNWKKDYVDYNTYDDVYHEIETHYLCEDCYEAKTTSSKGKHTYGWVKSGSIYWYECKKCKLGNEYSYNQIFSKTVKKKGSQSITYPCSKHDGLKYVKVVSGSKIIKIKTKGKKKTTFTCKKKGSAKIQVKMKSGALYTFKIKVK